MNKKLKTLGLAILLAGPVAAQAAVTFNFVNNDGGASYTSGAITFTGDDATTTLDASASNNSGGELTSYLDSAHRGLYVCTGASAPTANCGVGYGDQPHADGIGADETVTLDFGHKMVRLVQATFHETYSGNFDLGVNDAGVADEMALSTLVSFLGMDPLSLTGTKFTFSADGDRDWFKLSSITVKEVPLPGTLGLLGLGLAALGTARRRKTS